MREELVERAMNGTAWRPYGNIPDAEDELSFEEWVAYIEHLPDNLAGPIRIFRSAMLDLLHKICVNPEQKAAARSEVFAKEREVTRLLNEWIDFYGLNEESTWSFLRGEW